ncbi:unnamed protein product [Mesocestoides corti]|uniref:PDZ domain-containing protein n=1 Tax=Mesocestoides corti TaxID=53468 RepID=A0A158QUU2_MESCO|nr:unnamed protein product [Mesocestoides corti]
MRKDTLQRKYGELSGEIVIVEITLKDILDIIASNIASKPRTSTTPPPATPKGSPNSPITSFQHPTCFLDPRMPRGLGISLCGNKDLNQMAVLVCGLRPGSIAAVDGRISVGDQLLELNEHVLYGRSHLNAGPLIRSCLLRVLQKSSNKRCKTPLSLCFVICRNPENLANMAVAPLSYITETSKSSADLPAGVGSPSRNISPPHVGGSLIGRSTFEEVHATRLLRGRNGFGFAIMDKSFTNEPGIYIKQLVENGPAALDGTLRAGDRILRVDWHDALHASYDSVLEWIRSARHQVRIVISRVRLFTGDNMPSDDDELYKLSFKKRLSAPLISSLIHAFMHTTSSSSTSSKKSSLQLASMDDAIVTCAGARKEAKRKVSPRPVASDNFDLLTPDMASQELRRSSCPEAVDPGFAKRLAANHFLGVFPMASLTQLAGPPLPVMPLRCEDSKEQKVREPYGTVLERFASSYKGRHRKSRAANEEEELAATRPILPGKKTHIRIRRNSALTLGVSLIGGCETSLGVLQVHEIFPEGAVALDGRLQPGDRILAVNNESLLNLPYFVAVATIASAFTGRVPLWSQMDLLSVVAPNSPVHCSAESSSISLLVERPGAGVQTKWYDQEVTVDLVKKQGRGFGLCIVERSGPSVVASNGVSDGSLVNQRPSIPTEQVGLGVIVCDLIRGSTAYLDGRIMIGDQILAINDVDVEHSSQEVVATLLKTAQGIVTLRLGRLKNQPTPLNSVASRPREPKRCLHCHLQAIPRQRPFFYDLPLSAQNAVRTSSSRYIPQLAGQCAMNGATRPIAACIPGVFIVHIFICILETSE